MLKVGILQSIMILQMYVESWYFAINYDSSNVWPLVSFNYAAHKLRNEMISVWKILAIPPYLLTAQ